MKATVILILCSFLLYSIALVEAETPEDASKNKKEQEEEKSWIPSLGCLGSKVVNSATLGAVGTKAASLLGAAAGFTTSGIAKGSLAAFVQSKIGTTAVFSMLQSAGATGMLGPAGGAIAAGGYLYYYGVPCLGLGQSQPAEDNSETSESRDTSYARSLTTYFYQGTQSDKTCSCQDKAGKTTNYFYNFNINFNLNPFG